MLKNLKEIMMIKKNEYGTYGNEYQCPRCGIDHGRVFHHITEQLPILCGKCLNDDTTDINLRINTIIHYIGQLQGAVHDIDNVTSGLRVIR
jgi:hypothetical protein